MRLNINKLLARRGTGVADGPADRPLPAGPVLHFDEVTFGYGQQPAVEQVTFSVERGEFAAVLGPNGSGKTTLLRLGLGLIRPDAGSASLFGVNSVRFQDWARVGYVPQAPAGTAGRFPATVEEIVFQGLYRGFNAAGLLKGPTLPAVLEALETAGISDLRGRVISDLSVGQLRRALLARAMVGEPELLLLDEPVAGVDAAGQELFYGMLRRLNKERGMTIVMVSHDIGAVMREATTVACIDRTIAFHGPTHHITSRELSELYGMPVDVLIHDALHEHR